MKLDLVITAACVIAAMSSQAMASEWFVRPKGGNYGTQEGTSYANAWAGFSRVQWNRLNGGDTLHVCGTHNSESLSIGKDGGAADHIVIDGNCPGDAGMIYPKRRITGKWSEAPSVGKGVYKIDLNANPHVLIVEDTVLGKLNEKTALATDSSEGWAWFAKDENATGTNYNRVTVDFWGGAEGFWGYDAKGIKDPDKPIYIRFRGGDDPNDLAIYRSVSRSAVDTNGKNHITIRNLKYENSRYGIYIDGSKDVCVEDVASIGNYYAVCLKNTEGNIDIRNSHHAGAYYGMKNRAYYPHFAYNKTTKAMDRSIQVSSWASLWMKNRFPGSVFNQAGISLFAKNKGPVTIQGNHIENTQRGITITSSFQGEQQPLLTRANTIERAIRTALSIGWGWNARVEGNIFRNNNITFRAQQIDQAYSDKPQPGRRILFRKNRIYNYYDAGYAFFFHYNHRYGGRPTGVKEDLRLDIAQNAFYGGGGTHFGKYRSACFIALGTHSVFPRLAVHSTIRNNRIEWNTSDGDFYRSYSGRQWRSIDGNLIVNHADKKLPVTPWMGKENRIVARTKKIDLLSDLCSCRIEPEQWCEIYDFEEKWGPPGFKSVKGQPDFSRGNAHTDLQGDYCLCLNPGDGVETTFTPTDEVHITLWMRIDDSSEDQEIVFEWRKGNRVLFRYKCNSMTDKSVRWHISGGFGKSGDAANTVPAGEIQKIKFWVKAKPGEKNDEAHMAVWNGVEWSNEVYVLDGSNDKGMLFDNFQIHNDKTASLYIDQVQVSTQDIKRP